MTIIIRCAFFFLSIGREPTTWPANNCLQIMVCSCEVPSKRVLLQIIFCSCVIGTTFSREKWQIASLSCQEVIKIWKQTWWSADKTIIELGYCKISWFISVSQINYLPQPTWWSNDTCKTIELGYRKISWLVRGLQINYLPLSAFGLGKYVTDLLATDKSRYFAQPRPIIVNYSADSSRIAWF